MSAPAIAWGPDWADSVWRQSGERIRWQIAVAEDVSLSSSTARFAWRLMVHCVGATRWKSTVEAIGDKIGLKRSASFAAYAELRKHGYVEPANDGYLAIIPSGCRESRNPDCPSPEIRTAPINNAPAQKAREEIQEKQAAAASVLEASVGQPESPPIAAAADRHRSENDGVAGSEHCEVEQALLAREVAEPTARELARKHAPEFGLRIIMAVDNISRRKTITAGMYVAAFKNPGAYLPPPRPAPPPPIDTGLLPPEQKVIACWECLDSGEFTEAQRVGKDWILSKRPCLCGANAETLENATLFDRKTE